MEEMANGEFNMYFVDSVKEITAGNVEDDLLIGNKYPICALEQFNGIHISNLKNMVRKLINKTGTEKGITIEIMKLVVKMTSYVYNK